MECCSLIVSSTRTGRASAKECTRYKATIQCFHVQEALRWELFVRNIDVRGWELKGFGMNHNIFFIASTKRENWTL